VNEAHILSELQRVNNEAGRQKNKIFFSILRMPKSLV